VLRFGMLEEGKEAHEMKSYDELAREQKMRESSFLSDVGELTDIEAGSEAEEIPGPVTKYISNAL